MVVSFKSIELHEVGKYIHLKITGKLTTKDYDFFVPEIDNCIERHGKVNMLIELVDFEGWTLGAFWEDTKFGVRHFNDIARLAIVGNQEWEKNMSSFLRVFTLAKVKYFDAQDFQKAEAWVNEAEGEL